MAVMFSIKFPFTYLVFVLVSLTALHATDKPLFDSDIRRQEQTSITDFVTLKKESSSTNKRSLVQKPFSTSSIKPTLKTKGSEHIDLTKEGSATKKIRLTQPALYSHEDNLTHCGNLPVVQTSYVAMTPQHLQEIKKTKQNPAHSKSLPQAVTLSKPTKNLEPEIDVTFLHGTDEHIDAYADCIDKAESGIVIASWNLNYIPDEIFKNLMAAKRRGVYINFIVNAVKRKQTLTYFRDDSKNTNGESPYSRDSGIYSEDNSEYSDDSSDNPQLGLFETKSHAKFLFVDSKSLILGSYNALGDSYEESEDASFMLKGSIKQLWPFYMSIYESYTFLGEDVARIFGSNAAVSRYKYGKDRPLLRRGFEDESQIFLLRSIKEHEDFFKFATTSKETVTIYSPFSTRDNTLKRLKSLGSILPPETKVNLIVQEKFKNGLTRLLGQVPNLMDRATIEVATSHQKIVIVGGRTICVGSLNWLSAAQDAKDPYSNVEFSIVLQGIKAANIIKTYYGD